jgi:hypothetical protein
MSDDLTLHPRVRQAIYEGNRDKPLTLNWAPTEPDAYAHLGLPALNPLATKARTQIIAEALAAGQRFVSYSRHKPFYTHGQRYYRPTYSFCGILPAVDQLAAAGVIEHEKVPIGHRGFQSRFRSSSALLAETASTGVVYKPLEIIMVRDAEGNPVDYHDNRDTRRMRKRLQALNEGLGSLEVGIDSRIVREGDRLESGGRARVQLQRIFNRGDFEHGGRFYGAHWQNMEDRQRLSINGEDAVELDYVAMHIRLLYQDADKQLVGDPYDLEGWRRGHVKLALLIAINARTTINAVRALADALRLDGASDPFGSAQKLVAAVKARHPAISHAFGSDAGVRLMRRDSELAERIMWEMLHATGIVPLSVHDSFIVPASQRERLQEAMENAFPCGTERQKSLVEPTPNFATSYVLGKSTEPPETGPQYGTDGLPGMGGRDAEPLSPPATSPTPRPATREERIRGSSTVRAPAQAGDAGSSPAPVTKPDLTTMVLDIVNAQLDELEERRREEAVAAQAAQAAPVLAGDRHREAIRNRNREALQN